MTENNNGVEQISAFAGRVLGVAAMGVRDDAASHEDESADFQRGMEHAAQFLTYLQTGIDTHE